MRQWHGNLQEAISGALAGRTRLVNLNTDPSPDSRRLRGMIEQKLKTCGHTGTQEDPVPVAKLEAIVDEAMAEFNAELERDAARQKAVISDQQGEA